MSDGHLSVSAGRRAAPRTYAKCIHGREELRRRRIEDVLRDGDEDGGEDRGNFTAYSPQPAVAGRFQPDGTGQ
jgi:hypothetical protein